MKKTKRKRLKKLDKKEQHIKLITIMLQAATLEQLENLKVFIEIYIS